MELETMLTKAVARSTTVVVLEQMTFVQQVQFVQKSTMLMGVHGAGLTHVIFLKPGATLLEIVPPSCNFGFYKQLCREAGIVYHKFDVLPSQTSSLATKGDHQHPASLLVDVVVDLSNLKTLVSQLESISR